MTHSTERRDGADVVLTGVSKSFGSVDAVNDVSLHIRAGSFFSLLGPSGCGKSTTLRMIAGFETPDSGSIVIGGEDVTQQSPQRRPTAMVFQNYALFPHMTVAQNVEYGLRVRRVPKTERAERTLSALKRVEMHDMLSSSVTELSGGQQQRVALARAIVIQPAVLLFDEPLSNLDVALREQTRLELKHMQSSLGITSIYVTHDQEEALALSDQMAVMKAGSIVQLGTPEELYGEPGSAFVAKFLGGSNILRGEHAERLSGQAAPEELLMALRPESIRFTEHGKFVGRIRERQYLGPISHVWIDWEGIQLRATIDAGNDVRGDIRFDVDRITWVRNDLD